MRRYCSFLLALLIGTSAAHAGSSERDLPARPALDLPLVEKYVVYYTNIQRARYGLPLLRRNEVLSRAAQLHSEWMAKRRVLTHDEDKLPLPSDRVAAVCAQTQDPKCMERMTYVPPNAGGAYLACCSENAIESFDTNTEGVPFQWESDDKGRYREFTQDIHWLSEREIAYSLVLRWMHSPAHRRNILHPESSAIGFGMAHDGGRRFYGTQVFAPSKKRGIGARDYAVTAIPGTSSLEFQFAPGSTLREYTFRVTTESGDAHDLVWSKEGEIYRMSVPAAKLPVVVQIQIQDDTGDWFGIAQIRVQNEGGVASWKWQDWEVM